jgi:hypothetical protein
LFAIAAWIPDDTIDLVAWLIAVVLGLPASILAGVPAVRNAVSTGRLVPAARTFLPRVFGALSMLLGVWIIGWQVYNLFVRRLPEFTRLAAMAQALLPVALIGFGYRLLKRPSCAGQADHDPASPARDAGAGR